MRNTLLVCVVLVALIALQLASALKCYDCSGLEKCRSPTTVHCDESTANQTSLALRKAFNVTDLRGNDFMCLQMKLTRPNNSSALESELRGCVYRQLNVCSLPMNTNVTYGKICGICNRDLCNRNPAPKITTNWFTLLAAIIFVFLLFFK